MKTVEIPIPLHRKCCAFCNRPLKQNELHVDATNGVIVLTCKEHFDDANKLFTMMRAIIGRMMGGKN